MMKQLLIGGSTFVLLFVGSLSALVETSSAQTPSTPGTSETPTPSTQEAPQRPSSQTQQQTPQSQRVSSQELQQVVTIVPKLQRIDQAAQQRVLQTIEQSGISVDRFKALYQAQRSPETQPSSQATAKERESFNRASSQIQTIGRETQSQQEQAIRAGGMEPTRFAQILVAVRQDPALQQQVQQLLQQK